MYGSWLGPVLVAAGAALGRRRLAGVGAALGLGAAATFADIGARDAVPGANDNLTAVAALLATARSLRERPVEGIRVLLVSTGSEESFMEGMQAFGRRHFGALDRERTDMLCLECLGSPTLYVLEGEGMLRMRDYPSGAREALAEAAAAVGVPVARRLWTVAATDALVALRAGYRVATLTAVDDHRFPSNYHWPSDTPENLHWDTVEQAVAVCEAWVRRLARPPERNPQPAAIEE
jgi:Zn-dependent M28 family amino/carboxypeptidase